MHRGAPPDLTPRREICALGAGAHAQAQYTRVLANARAIELRPAVTAKRHDARIAAIANLRVFPRRTSQQAKILAHTLLAHVRGRLGKVSGERDLIGLAKRLARETHDAVRQ